jgi:enolase-phosphatase E1
VSAFGGKAVLLDIEGTTSSVRFVYEVLFPFARDRAGDYLKNHWNEAETQHACELIARDAGAGSLAAWSGIVSEDGAREKVVAEVHRLMDGDVKATGLKELQGLIWRDGYLSGQLCSHVYDDVLPALERWTKAGLEIRIYSSGSVTAQKLFFGHTIKGDLLSYFRGHYDTTTGPKKEAASYRAIAEDMGLAPGQILFCSDVLAELDAAAAAGLQTTLVVRPGNAAVAETHSHPVVNSFDDL